MYLDNKEEFQTVWELAHNWRNADSNKTDVNNLSFDLKTAIHQMIYAARAQEISVRTRQRSIFIDDSIFTLIFDFFHFLKINACLKQNKFNKSYLDSIYVKRNEVVDWCTKIYLEPPSCWAPKNLTSELSDKPTNKNRPKAEETDRLTCQAIARTLWALDPNIHPTHIARSDALQRFGNGKHYAHETIRKWISDLDPLKDQRNAGRPPEIIYKIDLKIYSQLKD